MHIQELRLRTHQLAQQRDFYTRVLGLPLSFSSGNQFALMIGASKLVFETAPQSQPLSYHFAFNIPEHQFVEAKQWLSARVELLKEPGGDDELYFSNWDAHSVYFPDLDGNILEFIAHHRQPQPQSQPFTAARLSSMFLILCARSKPGRA